MITKFYSYNSSGDLLVTRPECNNSWTLTGSWMLVECTVLNSIVPHFITGDEALVQVGGEGENMDCTKSCTTPWFERQFYPFWFVVLQWAAPCPCGALSSSYTGDSAMASPGSAIGRNFCSSPFIPATILICVISASSMGRDGSAGAE